MSKKGGLILATILIVIIIVAIAIVVILLVVSNSSVLENETINIGQINVNQNCTSSGLLGNALRTKVNSSPEERRIATMTERIEQFTKMREMRMKKQLESLNQRENVETPVVVQTTTQNPVEEKVAISGEQQNEGQMRVQSEPTIPKFTSYEDTAYSDTNQHSSILLELPNSDKYRWDPSKNFPSRERPVRPEGSFGAKFGPDQTQMELYIPSQEEIFLAHSHSVGPRKVRIGPRYHKGDDWRPLMIPVAHKDDATVRRGWKPRIDESYFSEAIELEKKNHQSGVRILCGDHAVSANK